jgi:glycosyltransferase involved in cell wall biosynthesis
MNANNTTGGGDILKMNWCVVIPTYNNERTLGKVVSDVLQVTPNVIVVNDGSTDSTPDILSGFSQIAIVSYPQNQGKGYALQRGFEKAMELGFSYAITIDSDGQHYATDIPLFLKALKENPGALIVGARTLPAEKMRAGSSFANRFSNFWFRFISGVSLPDTQSGFRLYPLESLQSIRFLTRKYEFELEVLIRSAWRGIPLMNIPIKVFYPEKEERVSHYRPFRDFVRISVLNAICVLIAILYVKPFSFIRYLKKENIKDFIKRNVLQTGESNQKLILSVMFGVFMGIVPIWGYQLITAIALAYLLRLNKLLVIVAANISIFPITPLILYCSYVTGGLILTGNGSLPFSSDITLAWVKTNLLQYLLGSVVFAVIMSALSGLLTYMFLKTFRRKPAIID